jgi:hypothetical protein
VATPDAVAVAARRRPAMRHSVRGRGDDWRWEGEREGSRRDEGARDDGRGGATADGASGCGVGRRERGGGLGLGFQLNL